MPNKESVYIIEDDTLAAEHLTVYLLDKGYEIAGIAGSAEEALVALEKLQPDIIFIDIVLSGKMDGIEAAKIINERYNLPIVYLTSYRDQDFFERAKLTTPCAYLLKPFNEAELELTIEMAIYRRKIMKRLIYAARTAEQASLAKTEFISRVNHELRTPLNAILGFGTLIKEDKNSLTQEQNEYVSEIIQAGRHMLALINEVLDLGRIESGNADIQMEKICLHEIAEACLSLVRSQTNVHSVEIINRIPRNKSDLVMGDVTRVKEVLLNLLSNAVKYNRPAGLVTLDYHIHDQDKVRVTVTDAGIGIKKNDRKKLFKPFERLDAGNTEIEGSGIGLVITKRLMELMGGDIGYENNPAGGSIFWADFQLAKPD